MAKRASRARWASQTGGRSGIGSDAGYAHARSGNLTQNAANTKARDDSWKRWKELLAKI